MDALLNLGPILPWYERIAALGHGTFTAMTPEEAFEDAKNSKPQAVTHIKTSATAEGIAVGSKVTVTPEDNARVWLNGENNWQAPCLGASNKCVPLAAP